MEKVWTPFFLPPPPEDVSGFSISALKVLRFLERQQLEPFSLRKMHESHFTDLESHCPIEEVPERSCVSQEELFSPTYNNTSEPNIEIINNVMNANNQHCIHEPTYIQSSHEIFDGYMDDSNRADTERVHQIETEPIPNLYLHPECGFANSLNESVDMFEETQPINFCQEKEIATSHYFTPQNPRNKNVTRKKSKTYTQIKKITSYFPVKKVKRSEKLQSVLDMEASVEESQKPKTFFACPSESPLQKSCRRDNFDEEVINNRAKTGDYNGVTDIIKESEFQTKYRHLNNFSHTSNELERNKSLSQLSIDQILNHNSPEQHEHIQKCSMNEPLNKINNSFTVTDPQPETPLASEIIKITRENSQSIFNLLSSDSVAEIGLTLCYREGFCLLNKDDRTIGTPKNILICAKFLNGTYQILDFTEDCFKMPESQYVLLHVLESLTRKICFEAQALILFILDNMNFNDRRVCYDWCILDPGVGGWLLDPDHPTHSFQQLKVLFIRHAQSISRKHHLNYCADLLIQQSIVMEWLYTRLTEECIWDVFLYLETKIIPILAVMEASEIKIDRDSVQKMSILLTEKLKSLEKEAERMVGHRFSITSTQQLRKVLYDELKLDEASNVKIKPTNIKGVKSTSESALKLLVDVHPLPNLILEYRQLFKLKSSYTDVFLEHTKENNSISARWDLCSTATGRVTSSNPNLQNIPKENINVKFAENVIELNLRSCFLARDDCLLVSTDFQQIELRVFAILAKDTALLGLLRRRGDIFTIITQIRLRKEEISCEERRQSKTLIYALMYGAGSRRIADILSLDLREAEAIRHKFIGIFPGLTEFNNKILNEVRKTKMLRSLSGRKRIFPNILAENLSLRKYSERQAINFIIQGSAADICKGAMLRIEMKLKQMNLNTKLLMQIHDELLWEVKLEQLQIFKDLVLEAMEANRCFWMSKINLEIPLPVLIRSGRDWANME